MIYNFLYASLLLTYNVALYAINSSIEASPYLNQPSGEYNVGYEEIHLINKNACPNVFFAQINAKSFSKENTLHCNEIELVVYYPSADRGSSTYRPIPSLISDLKEFDGNISPKDIEQVKSIRSHAKKNATVIKERSFPVIFFSPGYGLPTQEYENTLTDLASHGYVVIGINSQFINGELSFNPEHIAKVITPESEEGKKSFFRNTYSDLLYSYELLKTKEINDPVLSMINWRRVGLLGHSLGSAIVARFAYHTGICAVAGLDLTIDLLEGNDCHKDLKTPFLHIFSTQLYHQNNDEEFPYLCKGNRSANYKQVLIVGSLTNPSYSMHMNFCDYSTLQYFPIIHDALSVLEKNNPETVFLGTGNGLEVTSTINNNLLKFYNHYVQLCKLNAY